MIKQEKKFQKVLEQNVNGYHEVPFETVQIGCHPILLLEDGTIVRTSKVENWSSSMTGTQKIYTKNTIYYKL